MGLCGSAEFEKRYADAIFPLRRFAPRLHITDGELRKFFKYFEKVDTDKSGEIGLYEFFDLFQLDFSTFARHLFATGHHHVGRTQRV